MRGPDYTVSSYDIEDYVKTGERWNKDEKKKQYVFSGYKQYYKFRDDVQMVGVHGELGHPKRATI